eukprot:SAG11_NODE_6280_length_1345_cov_0.861156_2_plen_123_part_00
MPVTVVGHSDAPGDAQITKMRSDGRGFVAVAYYQTRGRAVPRVLDAHAGKKPCARYTRASRQDIFAFLPQAAPRRPTSLQAAQRRLAMAMTLRSCSSGLPNGLPEEVLAACGEQVGECLQFL